MLRRFLGVTTAAQRSQRLGVAVRKTTRGSTTPVCTRKFCSKVVPPRDAPASGKPSVAGSRKVELTERELVTELFHHQVGQRSLMSILLVIGFPKMVAMRTWIWVGGAVLAGVTLVAFGPELKVGVSKHTADVAAQSLQDETLQNNTRELASQIVQTVLNDPKVLEQASLFLQRLVAMPSTREALRTLIVQTLNDPVTLTQVSRLAKQTTSALLEDPKTLQQVVQLLRVTALDPQFRASLQALLEAVMKDEHTRYNLAQLVAFTFQQEPVKQSVGRTMADSVHNVLSCTDVQNHAKEFVSNVVRDQTVQAQSGDAIWSTMIYAITPTWLSWIWAQPPPDMDVETIKATNEVEEKNVVEDQVTATVEQKALPSPLQPGDEHDHDQLGSAKHAIKVARRTTTAQALRSHPHSRPIRNTTTHGNNGVELPVPAKSASDCTDPAVTEPLAPPKERSPPRKMMTESGKHFVEDFEDRNWSGTGSGFL